MHLRHCLAAFTVVAASVAVTAISVLAPASSAAAATATELFISEYVEGSGNNKALEFFNGTGAPVNLAAGQYVVQVYFNGATAPTTISLSGTVAAGDVFVFAAGAAAPTILAQADQTYGGALFNGDDAIVLRRGGATGTVLDSVGQVGVDPGTQWGTGPTSTADHTLRRAASVTSGDTTIDDAFDPAAQWQGYPQDSVDGLGAHSVDAGPVDQPAVLDCGDTLTTSKGAAVTRTVTATDPDDTITDLAVTAVTPTPAAGTISRTALTPATAPGGTASAVVNADTGLPPGSYKVTLTSTDAGGTTGTCSFTVQVTKVLTVGEVQGSTLDSEAGQADRSPLAPANGNGTSSSLYDLQGVITQKTLARTAAGASQYGFFLQSRLGADDGDPTSSDGIFVFMGSNTTLIGGYSPKVGDEVVLRARVSEFFNQTQLSSASLVSVVASGLDANAAVTVTDARPPADSTAADRYWERHEGERLRVRAGDVVTGARDVFASTDDSEIWLLDREDALATRTDPYARRVFRDAHPLDDIPGTRFDNGNGQRILIGSQGVKALAGGSAAGDSAAGDSAAGDSATADSATGDSATGDDTALLPPARDFDTLTGDAVGGLTYGFSKYSVQPERVAFAPGPDPSANHPVQAADRNEQVAVATFNMENLYDYRNDPFDGCDFTGDSGCPGVSPPFDYVPASEAAYTTRLNGIASQVINDMKAPDLILAQEAEDQDICTVTGGALACGTTVNGPTVNGPTDTGPTDTGPTDNADGKPDVLQELALAIAAQGGPAYDTAYDRNGADARGITSAFLYRTDRLSLPVPAPTDPILGSAPAVQYPTAGLPYNTDVQNPKALNAVLPADVDRSTGVDGSNVYTRAPQVAHFFVKAAPDAAEGYDLWAVSNHFSSTPDARVGQRTEQAAYGAAIAQAVQAAAPDARFVYGGDLNVFPRPDDPIARTDADIPSDQLGALYRAGLHNLWDDLAAAAPAAAYSYVFQGQAQTLDNLFVNDNLHRDLVEMRAAHVNADYAADYDGDGARGVSDHDPQVARFKSRPYLSVADVSVAEGNSGTRPLAFTVTLSRPLSEAGLLCASTLGLTAAGGQDYDPLFGCTTVTSGATTATFTVTVKGDRRREPDERFLLVVGGDPRFRYARGFATGTIVNDD